MADAPIDKIQTCEGLIAQFREALRTGAPAEADRAFTALMAIVQPILVRKAHAVQSISQGAVIALYEEMYDRLLDHLSSDSFPSLETKFGSYLKSMPCRAEKKIRANYKPIAVSLSGEEDPETHAAEGRFATDETIADPETSQSIAALQGRLDLEQALEHLPPDQQQVVRGRIDGATNNELAAQLGVSPATATRLFQTARARLRDLLPGYDED